MATAHAPSSLWWRNLLFVVFVPGVAAGLVPWLITNYQLHDWTAWAELVVPVAAVLVLAGTAIVLHSIWRFAVEGHGTPAPVAPTVSLVVGGLYRYVRNPMYLGVDAVVGGQALLSPGVGIAVYWAVVAVGFVAFARLYEEPTLRKAYGDFYASYRTAVPGWWPRRTPWEGTLMDDAGSPIGS